MDILEILDFVSIESRTLIEKIHLNINISDELIIVGDDFYDLTEINSNKYHVDMDENLWYFHSEGERVYIWSFIFKLLWANSNNTSNALKFCY